MLKKQRRKEARRERGIFREDNPDTDEDEDRWKEDYSEDRGKEETEED